VPEVLHPVVLKSIFKGTIALAVFSLFLEINAQTLLDYLSFVALFYVLLGAYAYQKRSTTYILGQDAIEMRSLLRAPRHVSYSDIESLSISQGILAKRFNCGTVYLNLAHKGGKIKILGGGSAEAIRDVRNPKVLLVEIEIKTGASQNTNLE
jgi:membrane protein YdbS with pleckstrin-like domain